VGNLVPHEPVMIHNPDKVGNIRGCDGIFTWHPFDADALQKSETQPSTLHGRNIDFKNHTVEIFDPAIHKGYKFTGYVQEALAPYEWSRADRDLLNPTIRGLPTPFHQSR
jgi:hypothetical protein